MHSLPFYAFNSIRWSLYLFNARFFEHTLLLSSYIYTQKTETEHENFWEGQIDKLVRSNLSFLFNLMLDNIDNAQGVFECQ